MRIDRIDPPFWYVDFARENRNLQIMIFGDELDNVNIETNIPYLGNVKILKDVDPHYLILNICFDVNSIKEGQYKIKLNKLDTIIEFNYELKSDALYYNQQKIMTDDVVYLIMPDRFARGTDSDCNSGDIDRTNPNGWHGGTIKGITDHLDYLKDLGVTTLWLTPVVQNNMKSVKESGKEYAFYHGYAATDFYKIDRHFGNLQDYMAFVSAAHSKDMKVVMDMVLNHCGISHPWAIEPPMNDWINGKNESTNLLTNYRLTTVVDPYRADADFAETVKGWFSPRMPDINMENDNVLQYFSQLALWWIATIGIDAIRVDTYPYVNMESMKRWQQNIHKMYPSVTIIAEAWVGETAFTAEIQRRNSGEHNSLVVMDFSFQKKLCEMLLARNREKSSFALYNHFVYDYLYNDASQVLAFIDNHDMQRWSYQCNDIRKTKQALGILFTIPRIPQILYGTELLFKGSGGKDDGSFRQDFPGGWHEDTYNKFLSEGRTTEESDVFNYTQNLIQWRKGSNAITRGKMKHFIPQDSIYVYFRSYENEKVMIVVNCKNKKKNIVLTRFKEEIGHYTIGREVVTGQEYNLTNNLMINENEILILNLQL